jgi:hypothetical protein
MNISEINRSIIAGSFTNEELNSIGDAIKFARSQIANKNKFTLVKGSKVKFTNSRSGGIVIVPLRRSTVNLSLYVNRILLVCLALTGVSLQACCQPHNFSVDIEIIQCYNKIIARR